MILLNQNQSNNVALTLNEKSTLAASGASVYYLFELVSDDTAYKLWFTGVDVSPNVGRFNQFNIIESGLTYVNLTASTINLATTGFYKYSVYEQTSPTNLNLSGTTGIVEEGKLFFSGSTNLFSAPNIYTGASTISIYNNN